MLKLLLKSSGCYNYYSEMGEETPSGCIFSARLSFSGNHFYLKSLNGQQIKGRGIKETGDGEYRVTIRAFKKLEKQFPIRQELFLD